MRTISLAQVAVFLVLFVVSITLGVLTVRVLLGRAPLGDFRGVVLVAAGILFIYLWAFAIYRLFIHFVPLREGELAEGSPEEFAAQVHFLFFLVLFNSLVRTHFVPVPVMRTVLRLLGARMGKNTYSAGAILDPALVEFGANCVVGHDAVLFSHVIEGRRLALYRIRVGNNVTIGAGAVVMPGVSVDCDATVSVGSVVLKGTQIGRGEIWGGIPARRLR